MTDSYLSYLDSPISPVGRVQARILGKATTATGTPLFLRLLKTAGTGLLAGVLIGAIIAVAVIGHTIADARALASETAAGAA